MPASLNTYSIWLWIILSAEDRQNSVTSPLCRLILRFMMPLWKIWCFEAMKTGSYTHSIDEGWQMGSNWCTSYYQSNKKGKAFKHSQASCNITLPSYRIHSSFWGITDIISTSNSLYMFLNIMLKENQNMVCMLENAIPTVHFNWVCGPFLFHIIAIGKGMNAMMVM